eukprot:2456003-Prymnesium_polylepis.2
MCPTSPPPFWSDCTRSEATSRCAWCEAAWGHAATPTPPIEISHVDEHLPSRAPTVCTHGLRPNACAATVAAARLFGHCARAGSLQ